MKIPTKLNWTNSKTINLLKSSLKKDFISIITTDTIPGLVGTLTRKSFDTLNKIKKFRSKKPYLILISEKKVINNFVNPDNLNDKLIKLIEKCWPGPLTLIFKAKKELPSFLTSQENTIALRCPNHEKLLSLLKYFDGLFSTSANKSEQKPPQAIDEIDPQILEQVKYVIIDDKKIDRKKSLDKILPSTVIDITKSKDNIIQVIRKGQYPIEKLERYYGTKFK